MPVTARLTWFLLLAAAAPLHAVEAPAALQQQAATAQPGDVLDISGVSPAPPSLPRLGMKQEWTGGTLAYSGSPENVPAPGILYRDVFPPGPARLMLYHVNATPENGGTPRPLKISVVAEPAAPGESATVTFSRRVRYGPQNGYFYIGTRSARDMLLPPSHDADAVTVSAPTVLDPALEGHVVNTSTYRQLVEGIYDMEITGRPVTISVVAVDARDDTLSVYPSLAPAPREERSPGVYVHDRGTFPNSAGKTLFLPSSTYSTANGLTHIRVGGGAGDAYGPDPWAGESGREGRDALLGIPSVLRGNWGVTYTIRLRATSPDGRRVAILANPRGGAYAGATVNSDSLTGAGAFLQPANGIPMSLGSQATLIGRWDPRSTPNMEILWTPPGASNMPVEFLVMPYPEPGDADGSGAVDLRDAVLALRFVNGGAIPTAKQRIAADVAPDPPDGAVTVADVARILQVAAGLR